MQGIQSWRRGVLEFAGIIREPERLAKRWQSEEVISSKVMIPLLLGNIVVCFGVYGLVAFLPGGWKGMLHGAWSFPLGLLIAWITTLPSFYIINALLGGQLDLRYAGLAASVTVCIGGLAMLAFVPLTWFFTMALPQPSHRLMVHGAVLCCVLCCMADVIVRVLSALDPKSSRLYGCVWLLLFSSISFEVCYLLARLAPQS